jgi:hypothetical protein
LNGSGWFLVNERCRNGWIAEQKNDRINENLSPNNIKYDYQRAEISGTGLRYEILPVP